MPESVGGVAPLFSRLMAFARPKPQAAPEPARPAYAADRFEASPAARSRELCGAELERHAMQVRAGISVIKQAFAHQPEFVVGVKRTEDRAAAAKQQEFLARFTGLLAEKLRQDPNALRGRLVESIRVVNEPGPTENVNRRLTIALGGPQNARTLAEHAIAELF